MLLQKYNAAFIENLNNQLAIYTTIGGGTSESPMWFQFAEKSAHYLHFKSSQNSYMFFSIPLQQEDVNQWEEFNHIYEHFKALKYSHIKENWPTVYYELRPSEKPVIPPPPPVKTEQTKKEESDYIKQATDFLTATGTTFAATYKKHDFYFQDDKQARDIYKIVLKNKNHRFGFTFGQSINNSNYGKNPPSPYDVLSCLTKYDVGKFNDFCNNFGYDVDSRKAYKTYKAVLREWKNVERLFTPEQIELLKDIN